MFMKIHTDLTFHPLTCWCEISNFLSTYTLLKDVRFWAPWQVPEYNGHPSATCWKSWLFSVESYLSCGLSLGGLAGFTTHMFRHFILFNAAFPSLIN